MIKFKKAITTNDFKLIENLASIIWNEYYTKIIGEQQVIYMLSTFQSIKAISKQVEVGYIYYMVELNNQFIGYVSVKEEKSELFLSKIYLLKDYRGKKIGKAALEFIEKIAKQLNLKNLKLTVNKYNLNAIKIYKHLGFKIKRNVVIDIGNGFVMDDFEMVKAL